MNFFGIQANWGQWILYGVGGLLALFVLKKILNFLGFSSKLTWGPINYWVVKKSHGLTAKEMNFLKKIGQSFRLTTPSSLVGNLNSLDYYFRYYISSLYNKKMNPWTRFQILNQLLEIRRKFSIVPLANTRIRHSRQFSPGSKIRIGIKGKGFFEGKVGESRYTFFTVMVPNQGSAQMLKKEARALCRVTRLGDAQYAFSSAVLFVSEMTSPMFVQLKHTRKLKRHQLRQDVRHKTDLPCTFRPVKMMKTKKGYVFADVGREEYTGNIKDLSSGGCAISSRQELKPGQFYKVRFKIVGEDIEIPMRVLRNNKIYQATDRTSSHFRFTGMTLKAKVLIQLYIYHLHPVYNKPI